MFYIANAIVAALGLCVVVGGLIYVGVFYYRRNIAGLYLDAVRVMILLPCIWIARLATAGMRRVNRRIGA